MTSDESRVVEVDGLDALIRSIAESGWVTWGPVVRDGAIVPGRISGLSDLPVGWHDEQDAGAYRLHFEADEEVFGWAVGPASWKGVFFPSSQTVWEASGGGEALSFIEDGTGRPEPVALFGVRPCELAGLAVLDEVLLHGAVPDPAYRARRRDTLVVVAECATPAGTCFCSSMGTGPAAGEGPDLVVTELGAGGPHRFLLRPTSERGARLIGSVPGRPATGADLDERQALLKRAEAGLCRRLDAEAVPALLARNIEHPHWQSVAERCLSCGNCTLVCPTCFCSDVRDTSDLAGHMARTRVWASCFDLDHSLMHGGAVRRSRAARYRQWMTHKLSTWHDQFGSSGCVGCGRCITWCPVGIDITAEVAAIASSEAQPGADGGSR